MINIFILIFTTFFISIIITCIIFWYQKLSYIINESIFLDFTQDQPIMRLNLKNINNNLINQTCENKQFYTNIYKYRKSENSISPGYHYNFISTLTLPRSPRNIRMLKFMLTIRLITNENRTVAMSSMPVVLPYKSDFEIWLDRIFRWPLYITGFILYIYYVLIYIIPYIVLYYI